jgi:hypothetical protein
MGPLRSSPGHRSARPLTRLDQRNWSRFAIGCSRMCPVLDDDSDVFGVRFLHPVGGGGWSVPAGFALDEHHAIS